MKASLLLALHLQMTRQQLYIHYKPLTIRALILTTMHLHITNSCAVRIKHHIHYPIFMACTGAVVISVMSDPYTFWTQVNYQAISPTYSLGMRLACKCIIERINKKLLECKRGWFIETSWKLVTGRSATKDFKIKPKGIVIGKIYPLVKLWHVIA